MFHLVLFILGGALQSGATSEGYLFGGRAIAGLSIGALTHIIPMYIAEVSSPHHLAFSSLLCPDVGLRFLTCL